MLIETKNNQKISLNNLSSNDLDHLADYLHQLSHDTKKRFSPHGFDMQSLIDIYTRSDKYHGYIAREMEENIIVAYSIIKIGYLEHDRERLASYGVKPDENTDSTFAPSVADKWQGMGIGNQLLQFIISDIKSKQINRIILWGGVQMDNENAVNYYLKNGFKILGHFSYHGDNYDMALEMGNYKIT